ncbi:hypothetical protein [Hanstruepera ponticola]|uniref:hypothetical protein n=1 Tax=Hanstruepera ponticola TaxID=2042995 RepID=UPI001786A285|nr:hypothetical protein [Hanstruepera ponticola]
MYIKKFLLVGILSFISCSTGNLDVIADLPSDLPEISAVEKFPNSDLLWLIEDAGNDNVLYGINFSGKVEREITITNAKNKDWEDLTTDNNNTIYIGDFGNNNEKRDVFTIYKIANINTISDKAVATKIDFELPKKMKSKDFEAFFLFRNHFYIFSKEHKKGVVIKVPNIESLHTAELVTEFEITGKRSKITSADISEDGQSIVLLNHDKAWHFSNFKGDDFFKGNKKMLDFKHSSQKEGICFFGKNQLLITDELQGSHGGNIYSYNLD